ncbi:MAG TPA: hypothetical protein EYP41_01015, partial [Anaerolineae bacterium]|nr:hypothetical protein [Anaerolineae bacterium]
MKTRSYLIIILALLTGSLILAGCTPSSTATCTFTANESLTAYRLPDSAADVFGVISTGESFEALARTAEGWVGFDPGVAQAGNIGL